MQETERLALYKKIFVILLFVLSFKGIAQTYPDPVVDSLLNSGINDIILQNYARAKSTFRHLTNSYPKLPLGNVYLVATEIARAYDYEEPYNKDYITENLDTAEIKTKNLLDKDGGNLWFIYFKALNEGYYAYYQVLQKNWLSAFSNGVDAVRDFEKCLNIDPEFYEAKIAIGSYQYWRSRKTEFLKWLPFIKDETELGISNLQIAVDHASYHRYSAINSLLWIYIDQKKYQEAINLAEKTLKQYPGSRFFMWPLARAYENIDIHKAIIIYNELLDFYSKMPDSNFFNEIVLKHVLAQLYVKQGDKRKALELCNQILSLKNIPDYTRDRLGDRLDRVEDLKQQLSGNH
jgi:tetratricopeptide (TPR) repeat protein